MKRKNFIVASAILLSCSITFSSCIGSFSLTSKLLSWNKTIDNKFVNELVFFAFWVLPVYEVSALADALVINSIEFWSGKNPVADNVKYIKGENGNYMVASDKNGYTITNEETKEVVELQFNQENKSWSVETNGQSATFMTFTDENHVDMYLPNGEAMNVELSKAGVLAYRNIIENNMYFANK